MAHEYGYLFEPNYDKRFHFYIEVIYDDGIGSFGFEAKINHGDLCRDSQELNFRLAVDDLVSKTVEEIHGV